MASAIPRRSPRTLRRVGRLAFLVFRPHPRGPAQSQGVDTSGDRRAAPLHPRLRRAEQSRELRQLLASGYYLGAGDAR